MTRALAWLNAMKFGLIIGFIAGWLALHYVGIPFFRPSYETLSIRLAGYADLEAEAVDTINQAEGLRAEENATSLAAIKGERDSRSAETARLIASYEAQITRLTEERSYAEDVCPTRRLIVPGELLNPSQELRASDPG